MSGRSLEDTVVGDYLIRDFIASGGMGEVYHAWHLNKQTPAAIKILRMDATRNSLMKERFSREVNALKRLWHSHIVRLYEFGELSDGRMYMIMEYVDGGTLYDEWTNYYNQNRHMPTERVVYTMHKVSVAMAHAHEQGVIHRDLKPSNILVRANGEPVVTDLGIAAMAGMNSITGTSDSLGTPIYMAPEQLAGDGYVDERVDIYAIGVMMYELLTGRRPYEAENNWALINAKLNYDPVPLYEYRPDIPWNIRQVVSRCLQLDPEYRHASSELLAEDLRTILGATISPPALIVRREPPPPPQFTPPDPPFEPDLTPKPTSKVEPEPETRFHYPPIPRPEDAPSEPEPIYNNFEPELDNQAVKNVEPVRMQAEVRPRELRPAAQPIAHPPPPSSIPLSRPAQTQPVVLERTIIEQKEPPHDPRLDPDPPPFRPTRRPVRKPGIFESFILRLLNGVSSPEPISGRILLPLAVVALALILVVGLGVRSLLTGRDVVEATVPAEVAAGLPDENTPFAVSDVTNNDDDETDINASIEATEAANIPRFGELESENMSETSETIVSEIPEATTREIESATEAAAPLPTDTVRPTRTSTATATSSATRTHTPSPSQSPRATRTPRPTFTPTSDMIAVTVETDEIGGSIPAVIVTDTLTATIEVSGTGTASVNETVEPDETPTRTSSSTETPLAITTITPTLEVDVDATETIEARVIETEAAQEAEATVAQFAADATATRDAAVREYEINATRTREALQREWKATETARAVPPEPIVINRAGQCINVPFGGQINSMTWTWRGTLQSGQSFTVVFGAPGSAPSTVRQTGITPGRKASVANGVWQTLPFNHQLVRGNYSWTVWIVQNGQAIAKAQNNGCLNVN